MNNLYEDGLSNYANNKLICKNKYNILIIIYKLGKETLLKQIQRFIFALAMFSSLVSAWNQRGLVDCGGLFLLDQIDYSFSSIRCSAIDSVTNKNIMVYGGYGLIQGTAAWKNEWNLEWKKKDHYGEGGFRGDTRYLSLGADFVIGPTRKKYSGISVLNLADSLVYASASISRKNSQIFNLTWIPENGNQIIDTVSGNWESNLLDKKFTLGMVYR